MQRCSRRAWDGHPQIDRSANALGYPFDPPVAAEFASLTSCARRRTRSPSERTVWRTSRSTARDEAGRCSERREINSLNTGCCVISRHWFLSDEHPLEADKQCTDRQVSPDWTSQPQQIQTKELCATYQCARYRLVRLSRRPAGPARPDCRRLGHQGSGQ